MKIHILDKLNTSIGFILSVDSEYSLKKNDFVVDDDGNEYIVTGIHLSSKPEGINM